jgi:hypothetical protein
LKYKKNILTFDPVSCLSVSFLIDTPPSETYPNTLLLQKMIELVDDGYKMRFRHIQICSTGIRADNLNTNRTHPLLNPPERVQILGHAHIICITVVHNPANYLLSNILRFAHKFCFWADFLMLCRAIYNLFIAFKHWQTSPNKICEEICRIKIITIPLSRWRMFYIILNVYISNSFKEPLAINRMTYLV